MSFKYYLSGTFLITTLINGISQSFSRTYSINEDYSEFFKRMIVDEDTIYTISPHFCDTTECFTIGKFDGVGTLLKSRLFSWMDEADEDSILKEDSVIIVAGSHGLYENSKLDLLVLSSNLDSIFHASFDLPDSIIDIEVRSVIKYLDYYVVLGFAYTESDITTPAFIAYIRAQDYSLDTIIPVQLGSKWTTLSQGFVRDSQLVVSYRRYNGGIGIWHGFIILNQFKLVDWSWESNRDTYAHLDADAVLLDNGNLVFKHAQDYQFQQFSLSCVTPGGETAWTYDSEQVPFGRKELFKLTKALNGDILGCGQITWRWNPDIQGNLYTGSYLLRIDPISGDLIWERGILDYDQFGYYAGDTFLDIKELPDNSLILCGSWKVFDSSQILIDYKGWLVRTDSEGCVIASCMFPSFTTSTNETPVKTLKFLIAPNPVGDHLQLQASEWSSDSECTYHIIGIDGVELMSGKYTSVTDFLNVTMLAPGMYVMVLHDKKSRIVSIEKFIKS